MKSENSEDIAKRSIGDWFDRVMEDPFVLEDRRCPARDFSPEQWKELILNDVRVLQFDVPGETVRKLLSRRDFADWESSRICDALFFGGVWLADLLPMENIVQEDFDFYFGEEAFPGEEEFRDVAPGFFPDGFPPHLELPYAKPEKRG